MTVVIAPIHETFFSGRIWMGLDVEKIQRALVTDFQQEALILDFGKIAQDYSLLPLNSVLFYTTSYNDNYNQFIKDVVYDISQSRPDVSLFPNLDQLYSFENKGYQELYKKRIGVENVKGNYFGDVEELDAANTVFPLVYKSLKGAMSSGVHLVTNSEKLNQIDQEAKKLNWIEKLKRYRKESKKDKDQSLQPVKKYSSVNFDKFFSKRNPFVLQEFIPNMTCDYKVLVFGEQFYVLQRKVRDNDFKASGSGKFEWVEPSSKILDYALELQQKMKVPFNSFDIIETDSHCALVEYQGIGFGPLTLIGSSYHYVKKESGWQKVEQPSNLEETYAYAIHYGLMQLQQ